MLFTVFTHFARQLWHIAINNFDVFVCMYNRFFSLIINYKLEEPIIHYVDDQEGFFAYNSLNPDLIWMKSGI